jgi:hypothetical protein
MFRRSGGSHNSDRIVGGNREQASPQFDYPEAVGVRSTVRGDFADPGFGSVRLAGTFSSYPAGAAGLSSFRAQPFESSAKASREQQPGGKGRHRWGSESKSVCGTPATATGVTAYTL